MFEYAPSLQKTYTHILEAPARFLRERLKLTPNILSIIAFLICMVGLGLFLGHYTFAAVMTTLFGLLLDALDGTMARMYNMQSRTGFLFETYFDGIHEVLLYPVLAVAGYVHPWLAALSVPLFLFLQVWKYKNKSVFDGGFKRVSVVFGYVIHFEYVLCLALLWNLFALCVNFLHRAESKLLRTKTAEGV